MWNDRETDIDLLDFLHLTSGLLSIIRDDSLLPATIGIFGDWGSGKSSLLRMVIKEIEQEDGVFCITFNGWLFEGYDDAKTALLETIIKEIETKKTLGTQAKEKIKKLLGKINWMRVAFTVGKYATSYFLAGETGLAISAVTDIPALSKLIAEKVSGLDVDTVETALKDLKRDPDSSLVNVRGFHEEFEELIDLTKIKKLVVFIDDLDRCSPETIIETLDAIRLFLYAKKSVFIIAADERLVKYAVTKKYPDIPSLYSDISRDYLEKFIQFPISVPPLGPVEVETYMKLLFLSKLPIEKSDFEKIRKLALEREPENLFTVTLSYSDIENICGDSSKDIEEDIILCEYLAPILSAGLNGNPRQIKRFLNTILFRQNMAQSKGIVLQTKVLAKLMLLEYLRPIFFRQLADFQAIQNGKPVEIILFEEISEEIEISAKVDEGDGDATSREEDKEEKRVLLKRIDFWLKDGWMVDWVGIAPKFTGIDLRPYFYFSRDKLPSQKDFVGKLSPLSQEIINNLLSSSDAKNRLGVEKIIVISPSDASVIFNTIISRIRSSEEMDKSNRLSRILLDIVEVRQELGAQLLSFLDNQPVNRIPISLPKRVLDVIAESELRENARVLVKKWAKNTNNNRLQKAAEIEIRKLGEG